MIQVQTKLKVADNSGAKEIMCIRVVGEGRRRYAAIGDIITASVKQAVPNTPTKKGSVVKAVVVRTRSNTPRPDGTYIRFDDNAAVLLDNQGNPVGTRVFGPVGRELREKKYLKIVSLAPEVL